ncbi:MAG TPA: glycosyltransferase family 39 protein [Actinomycetota bacterium]|nr:glycosyltransferase family 39 protein [Actinomycetota bacterium]
MRTPKSVWILASLVFAASLILASSFGPHRDELYFIACARRLAWGYVDQPPLVPAIYRLGLLMGQPVLLPRWIAAAMAASLPLVIFRMTIELDGNRNAGIISSTAIAVTPFLFGSSYFMGPTTVDIFVWSVATLIFIKILHTDDHRLWLRLGGVVGLGLLNKHTILYFVASMGAGLLIAGRAHLRTWWPWAGLATAIVIWAPNLVWQSSNGWPTLEMIGSLRRVNGGLVSGILFLPSLFVISGPVTSILAIGGAAWLLRSKRAAYYRSFGWMCLATMIAVPLSGGRPYYAAPIVIPALGAGARWFDEHQWRVRRVVPLIVIAGVLPLIPLANSLISAEVEESRSWAPMAAAVEDVRHALPEAERDVAIVLASDRGQAAAIERFAKGSPVFSGHNNFWEWGPPPGVIGVTVAVGFRHPNNQLQPYLGDCSLTDVFRSKHRDTPIYLCRGSGDWRRIWPRFRHYDTSRWVSAKGLCSVAEVLERSLGRGGTFCFGTKG